LTLAEKRRIERKQTEARLTGWRERLYAIMGDNECDHIEEANDIKCNQSERKK
jgi:hypothetical protein